ncbi:MAG: carboxypeptidase regulatory-like domain-containing protein [Nitrospirae bacterium]|nr:carboxypeptidase regulatory-like domain-containing protein [Candidatus Manganitrophaceae bacterium]
MALMKKQIDIFKWTLLILLCLVVSPVFAYDTAPVEQGGTITGKAVLSGPIPEPRTFPMVLYPFGDFCKKISDGQGLVLLKEFNVDPAGGLQDVVVAVQNVTGGKGFRSNENKLVTVNCMFHPSEVTEDEQFDTKDGNLIHIHPLVSVMRNHHLLSVVNRDPVIHDAQIYQKETGHRVVRFPIPVTNRPNRGWVDLDAGKKIAQIICGMHEYMQTWVWVVDNPYFDKTTRTGEFSIDRLPPGTYKVTAWHPHMKPIEKTVTVPPNGQVELNFEFDARQVIRPIYETQEAFRIPPEMEQNLDIFGCEGPYCVKGEHHHHED